MIDETVVQVQNVRRRARRGLRRSPMRESERTARGAFAFCRRERFEAKTIPGRIAGRASGGRFSRSVARRQYKNTRCEPPHILFAKLGTVTTTTTTIILFELTACSRAEARREHLVSSPCDGRRAQLTRTQTKTFSHTHTPTHMHKDSLTHS